MIPITYIKRNLRAINTKYRAAKKPLHNLLLAKLAIIEVGGWVEMSMDDLVLRSGRKLSVLANAAYLKTNIVERTWGFDYKQNFRQMLMRSIGLILVEQIEGAVDGGKFAKMNAALGLLKSARNDVAHTYVKHIIIGAPIPAPSLVATYFLDIYDGLKDLEAVMVAKGLI